MKILESKLKEAVEAFPSGCNEGKERFLRKIGVVPERSKKSFIVTIETDAWMDGQNHIEAEQANIYLINRVLMGGMRFIESKWLAEKNVTFDVKEV